MEKLIIHIGPPKTATTSLQLELERQLPADIIFLGALQPRERNGRTLCHVLNDWVMGVESDNSHRVLCFLDQVAASQKNGVSSIVVEEVLLDSSQGMRWNKKLIELAKKTASLNAVPAITLRNPIDGMLSLHREFRGTLGRAERASATLFSLTHQARVYDYRYLIKSLRDAGFKEVQIILFDEITTTGFDLRHLRVAKESTEKIYLEKHNSTASSKNTKSWIFKKRMKKIVEDYYIIYSAASVENFSSKKISSLLKELGEPCD